ncbi:MAG: imidazole glycerol phosphate synthase subunit HisH [candidate division KSB1 bacterium]|nr:imidazole glycerol phosphate synthase subunit HisH [candidate division KSB1 bacterium]
MIAIIDYGAGNLRSVKKAFDYLKVESQVISSPDQLTGATKIVLPGVGAFGAAVQKLHEFGFYDAIRNWLLANQPFLGICLGMQLLLETSQESPGVKGLSIFEGENLRFDAAKVPQIGWNQVQVQRKSRLFADIPNGSFFYFLHGYYLSPREDKIIIATTDYGIEYPSAIELGNIAAVQFHPEKSGDLGLRLLKNWIELC